MGEKSLGWGLKDNVWSWDANLTAQNYQEQGFSDYKEDSSVISNSPIQGQEEGDTGQTYLGFNDQAFYIPADSNGSSGMLGLSNWFRDAISGAESSIAGLFGTTNETFQVFTGGVNDPDPSTASKARRGDRLENNNMFEYILNSRSIKALNVAPDDFQALIDGNGIAGLWADYRGKSDSTLSVYNTWTYDKNGSFKFLDTAKYIKNNYSTGFMRFMNSVDNQRILKSKNIK